MEYISKLKISGIMNLTDARYAAGVWAQWAGFCFDPANPNYVDPVTAKDIIGWISGPQLVGEFGLVPFESVKDITKLLGIGMLQISADYPDNNILSLGKAFILEYKPGCRVNEQLKTHNYIWLADSLEAYNELIAKGETAVILQLKTHNADQVKALKPYGIALKGEPETETGIRDYEAWNDLLEAIAA